MSSMAFWTVFLGASLLFSCAHSFITTTLPSNETDALSLLAMRDEITGDALSSWNRSIHVCEWHGITCGRRHRRVTALSLSSLGLVGTISPYIANLTFLTDIDLSNNSFHGKIPVEIGRLFRLQFLDMRNNSLEGELPPNLSNCSRLVGIGFNWNKLVGRLPSEFGSLSNLTFLGASNNRLTGSIPASYGNLSYLYLLNVPSNSLSGSIPYELGQLVNLQFLQISVNHLSGEIPPPLFNLSALTSFSAIGNNLQGSLPADMGITLPNIKLFLVASNRLSGHLPLSISNASWLEHFNVGNNSFGGPIPLNLGRLQHLVKFWLYNNRLESRGGGDLSFLTELTNCSSLQVLNVWSDHLRGSLPDSIANLSANLRQLSLGANEIHGSIPAGIENLVNLQILTLPKMLLTGAIPATIGRLNKLEVLGLNYNKLSGEIPSSIGNITGLSILYLHVNELQGGIPPSLGNFRFLQELSLSKNSLSGIIPKQIFSLPSLTVSLDLSHNSFTGPLPPDVGILSNLGRLDISNNQLSGEIPSTLGSCLGLEYLNLSANSFNGSIPSGLRILRGISQLDLSQNNFSGGIPKYLADWTNLKCLNISFNDLEGEVPEGGIFQNSSAVSVIGNSKLCGGVEGLKLPACSLLPFKRRGRAHNLKKILLPSGAALCIVFFFCFLIVLYLWRRNPRKESPPSSSLEESNLTLTYRELYNATNGFSSTNLIGEGSHGSVYKGVLQNDGREVAVKVLNLRQRGAFESFAAECEALRNIRHRNLVKIITACSSIDFKGNDFKALVFAYLRSGSLENWLHPEAEEANQSRHLTFGKRVSVAIDVASALGYLHHHCETPIVHRDLKPSNVLLDDDMKACVTDFGISKFLHPEATARPGNQTSSAMKGTTGYIAPEYGMGNRVSTQGDVYSYGILLLEMFTGKRPTDDMFSDGLSLHQFVKRALPEGVKEVADPQMLSEEGETEAVIQSCLLSVLRTGVMCSEQLPSNRMAMEDVVAEMHSVRDLYLGTGIHRGSTARTLE